MSLRVFQKLLPLLLLEMLTFGIGVSSLPSEEIIVQQQVNILKDLTVKLHEIHQFDNFIVYRTPRKFYGIPLKNVLLLRAVDQGRYLNYEIIHKHVANIIGKHIQSSPIQKPMMSFTISPWEYVNNTKAIPNFDNIITKKNLAIVILNDIFSIELKEFIALSLGACLETKIVFLLTGHEITGVSTFVRIAKLRRFFRWCWAKNILDVILLFQKHHIEKSLKEMKLDVYTYTPFPYPFKIVKLTEQHPSKYFVNRISDILGYKFRTPVIPHKPLVFKSLDPFSGNETVTGISGKIYMEYTKYINGTFTEYVADRDITDSWIAAVDYIHYLLKYRHIHIAINPFTALVPNNFSNTYPISNTNCCVVVPVKQEIYPGLYIARTLSLRMWYLLLILFSTFLLLYMFINWNNYGQVRPWMAFSTTLRGMLNMPVGDMGECNTISMNSFACRRKICVHMLLLLTGMIYCQMHIAALSSFLSSTLYPDQIESMEDLIKANLSIMLVDYVRETYAYLDLIPYNFSQHLIVTDADTVSYHLHQLDTRYAYIAYNEEWRVIQHLQMHLSKPRFKIASKLCIPNVYLNLPTQFNSPFYHSFKEFVLLSQSSGLDIKWKYMVYWQIHKANGLNASMMHNLEYSVPFGLEHLIYIFYIYAGGMLSAAVAFLVELNTANLSKKF